MKIGQFGVYAVFILLLYKEDRLKITINCILKKNYYYL